MSTIETATDAELREILAGIATSDDPFTLGVFSGQNDERISELKREVIGRDLSDEASLAGYDLLASLAVNGRAF